MNELKRQELPRGWGWANLEDIVEILDGERIPVNAAERAKRTGEIPYYGATGQVGWIDDFLFDEPLVLLGEDGAPFFDKTRSVAYVISGKSWVNNHAHVLRAVPRISLSLLAHQLNTVNYHGFVSGTTRWKLSQAPMRRIPLRIPPFREQQRIANALDELLSDLDAGVAALERARAKLEQYRAAVLKAAVEGTLTAEWRDSHPDTEPASALLTRILTERRRRWEEAQLQKFKETGKKPPKNWKAKYREPVSPDTTDLAPLPEGWCWITMDAALDSPLTNGISVKGSESPPGVPSLRLNAMTERGFDYSKRRYLPLKREKLGSLWIRTGDFFVSRGNGSMRLVGRGTLAQDPREHVLFPDTMIRARFVPCLQRANWISTIWASHTVRLQIERAAKTTAGIWKISQSDLARVTIPLPPLSEQEAIVEIIEDQLSVIDHLETDLEAKLQSAQALRQSILHHAFSGQLVPQDPSDEPASVLLEHIAAEREERAQREKALKQSRRKAETRPRTRRKRATRKSPVKDSHD